MTQDPVRAAVLEMDTTTRRAVLHASAQRINADPNLTEPMTRLWSAIYDLLCDLDRDELELLARLESTE